MAPTRYIAFIILCFASALLSAKADRLGPVFLPVHPERLAIVTLDGDAIASFDVEIAVTIDQRATGLMHRKNFGGDASMLFDFKAPGRIAMWMKNTPSPLDILFANSDGEILAIETDTTPFSLTVISPDVFSHYVVEIGAGEVAKRGIQIGQFLHHPTIKGRSE